MTFPYWDKKGSTPKLNFTLPFDETPRLLLIEGDDIDIIEIQYQLLTNPENIILFESALYISYSMENYLIVLLTEENLCYKINTAVEYLESFSILKI